MRAVMLVGLLALVGCGRSSTQAAATAWAPEDAAGAECAVCGMVVREQPAPRGQVVHRDGERRFLCSLGDLRVHVQSPGPLGAPEATFVEALPEGYDLHTRTTEPLPWLRAEEAHYVVGFQRLQVMGKPVGAFSTLQAASAAAQSKHAWTTTWAALRATPFNELPPNAWGVAPIGDSP